MFEEFPKYMLKSGMHIVEFRNGERKLYLNERFIGLHSGISSTLYNDDLTLPGYSLLDVVKVFLVNEAYNSLRRILNYPDSLVWQRKEGVTISKYEALRKLKEVYGEEVSVEW